jgi:hypothetical protein
LRKDRSRRAVSPIAGGDAVRCLKHPNLSGKAMVPAIAFVIWAERHACVHLHVEVQTDS